MLMLWTISLQALDMMMHLCLVVLILVVCLESISVPCSRISYTSKSQCEEALSNDARNYPTCSSLNFFKQRLICQLRSRADLDELRSGRRALPGVPVSTKSMMTSSNGSITGPLCGELPGLR